MEANDTPCFAWGETIEGSLEGLKRDGLIAIVRSLAPRQSGVALRSCKDAYNFIAAQDVTTQRLILKEVQAVLATPNVETCTVRWMSKHSREEEQVEVRNIRQKIDGIIAGFRSHGNVFFHNQAKGTNGGV